MRFQELQTRLIHALQTRVRSGEISERRLARLTGVSQPYIHNVLKGRRIFSQQIADRILRQLRIGLQDLWEEEEIRGQVCAERCPHGPAWREVGVLEGYLGPGLPVS
jgi:hypothetical protein